MNLGRSPSTDPKPGPSPCLDPTRTRISFQTRIQTRSRIIFFATAGRLAHSILRTTQAEHATNAVWHADAAPISWCLAVKCTY